MKDKQNIKTQSEDKPFNPQKPWLPDPSTFVGTWREDWRIDGQEGYLMNSTLQYITYSRDLCVDDFLQCEFCFDKFDEDPEHPKKAYFDPIQKCWICEECFQDFKEHFHWIVEGS
ncbi:MAG: hypothetical protein IJ298_09065 [Ruminococcus sp.]|nr:hypothetical protein [Ruminococcus sp.]